MSAFVNMGYEPRLRACSYPSLSLAALAATTLAAMIVRSSACLSPAKEVTAFSAAQQKLSVVPERSSIATSRMSPNSSPFSSGASYIPSLVMTSQSPNSSVTPTSSEAISANIPTGGVRLASR
jgi:hypothetical protein